MAKAQKHPIWPNNLSPYINTTHRQTLALNFISPPSSLLPLHPPSLLPLAPSPPPYRLLLRRHPFTSLPPDLGRGRDAASPRGTGCEEQQAPASSKVREASTGSALSRQIRRRAATAAGTSGCGACAGVGGHLSSFPAVTMAIQIRRYPWMGSTGLI